MKRSPQPSQQALADLHDSAYRWALVCCGFEEDGAQEVMQMVYVEILAGRAVYHGRASLKTWLFAVVRNTALRVAAGTRRIRAIEDKLARAAPQRDEAEPAEAELGRQEARRAILAALQSLSPQQRQIVELVYYHDLTVAEAATVMNTGLGSARQHFHRAKHALAQALWPLKEVLGEG